MSAPPPASKVAAKAATCKSADSSQGNKTPHVRRTIEEGSAGVDSAIPRGALTNHDSLVARKRSRRRPLIVLGMSPRNVRSLQISCQRQTHGGTQLLAYRSDGSVWAELML